MSRPVGRSVDRQEGGTMDEGSGGSEEASARSDIKRFLRVGLDRAHDVQGTKNTKFLLNIYSREKDEIVRGRETTAPLSLSFHVVRRARNGRSAGKNEEPSTAPVVRSFVRSLVRSADTVVVVGGGDGGGAVVDVPIIYIILCPMCLCR